MPVCSPLKQGPGQSNWYSRVSSCWWRVWGHWGKFFDSPQTLEMRTQKRSPTFLLFLTPDHKKSTRFLRCTKTSCQGCVISICCPQTSPWPHWLAVSGASAPQTVLTSLQADASSRARWGMGSDSQVNIRDRVADRKRFSRRRWKMPNARCNYIVRVFIRGKCSKHETWVAGSLYHRANKKSWHKIPILPAVNIIRVLGNDGDSDMTEQAGAQRQ
jgi:hypothetical protein